MEVIGYAVVVRGEYEGIILIQLCDSFDNAIRELAKTYSLDLTEYDSTHIEKTHDEDDNLKTIHLTDGDIITYTVEEVRR